jgi:hypothetical protein
VVVPTPPSPIDLLVPRTELWCRYRRLLADRDGVQDRQSLTAINPAPLLQNNSPRCCRRRSPLVSSSEPQLTARLPWSDPTGERLSRPLAGRSGESGGCEAGMSKQRAVLRPKSVAQKRMSEKDFFQKYSRDLWGNVDQVEFSRSMSATIPLASLAEPSYTPPQLPPFLSFPLFPLPVRPSQQRDWWVVRMLKAAAKENSPQSYQGILEFWLLRIGAPAPSGVFNRSLGPPAGRPVKDESIAAHTEWVSSGRPSLDDAAFCDRVA